MVKAHKKVVVAKQGRYQIKLVNTNIRKNQTFRPMDEGLCDVITRYCNHLDEQVVIINEYEEVFVIKNNGNKSYKDLEITFTHSKIPITNKSDQDDCSISLLPEDFKDGGCVYIPELNIVVALAKAYEVYQIRHPHSIYKHKDILNATVEKLKEDLTNLALMWYVNEPEKSRDVYYLGLGQDVIPLHKTHHPDNCVSFVMISPESQNPNDINYDTQIFDINNLKDDEVREITYCFGKNKYVLYIGKNINSMYKDIEKRQKEKNTKRYVGKSEYEETVEKLKQEYTEKLEIELTKINLTKDQDIEQLNEKIRLLQKTIDTLEDRLRDYREINNMYDEKEKRESSRYSHRAKIHTAETNARKERMALFADILKYGIGGLVTLITLLTAQQMKKK